MQLAWTVGIIKSQDNLFVFRFSEIDVGRFIRRQIPQATSTQCGMLTPHPQEWLDETEWLLLFRCASLRNKRAVGVVGPAAWEIAPVVWISGARHTDFVPVIDFRDAAQRQCQTKRQ